MDYSALLRRLALIAHLVAAKLPGIGIGLAQLATCVSARWVFQDVTTAVGPNVRPTG